MSELEGKTALVTGASSGIGADFARLLASRGMHLVVTARRADRLAALAAEIEEKHGVSVTVIATDLSAAGAAELLFAETEGAGRPIELVLNNAGFGTQEAFTEIPWEKTEEMIRLNVLALTEITWRFVRAMKARGHGHVLNVASIGAYLPVPRYATYAAGKAYVRNFTEALAFELHGTGVRVCCLCPGATATEFMEVSGHKLQKWQRSFVMSSEQCARIGLVALFAGRRNIVSGVANKVGMFLLRLLPRRVMTWVASRVLA